MARIVPAVRGMYIALTLHLLWTLGAAAVITRRQRIPASAAAWLALVFLLPVAGTLLYVLAGYRRAVPAAEPCDCRGDAVEQIVARGCGTRPAPRNSVSLLHNGSNAFTALIAALQHAVRSIHMEYYIIRDDRIGRTIAEILIRKARVGLEVRVIYDAVGSWRLQPHDTAPHARRRGTHGRLRAGALPVVHHARLTPQPPQNRRHGRPCRLSGWHKYCEILPRRRLHGQVARRAPPHRGRRREGLAAALHRRLGAGHGRMSRPAPLRRPARHPAAPADPAGLVRRGPLAADHRRGFRSGRRPGQTAGAHLAHPTSCPRR